MEGSPVGGAGVGGVLWRKAVSPRVSCARPGQQGMAKSMAENALLCVLRTIHGPYAAALGLILGQTSTGEKPFPQSLRVGKHP